MDFGSMLNKLKRDAAEVTAAGGSSSGSTTACSRRGNNDDNEIVILPNSDSIRNKRQKITSSSCSDKRQEEEYCHTFPTTPVRTIYLICPPNVQTGGPEAMHQLCHALNTNSDTNGFVRAQMLYLRVDASVVGKDKHEAVRHDRRARCPEAYEQYDAPPALYLPGEQQAEKNEYQDQEDENDKKLDYSDELVVWPECWTHLISSLPTHSKSNSNSAESYYNKKRKKSKQPQTAIWWLSVNNNNNRFRDWHRNDILHLYQSEYAKQYLIQHGAEHILKMTEYIPDRHYHYQSPPLHGNNNKDGDSSTKTKNRDIDVLYNPAKGMHYTHEILKRSHQRGMTFHPIGGGMDGRERISPQEVTNLLHRAKIYIDFGPHPGMDRLPREAALAGCIVITNREGAAWYEEDVPIPDRYKMDKFDVDVIHRLLRSSLEEYESRMKEFDTYREWIAGQEKRMMDCVEKLMEEVVYKRRNS